MLLAQVQQFGIGTRYGLEILHQSGKRIKTKSQEVFGANSYVAGVKLMNGSFAPLSNPK